MLFKTKGEEMTDNNGEGKRCTRCIMDSTVPGITFDENGECTYCKIHDALDTRFPLNQYTQKLLEKIILKIKKSGKRKRYDCIVGLSGGRDSTYTLYYALKLGLRPLAVHFDNGWNTDISVSNIKKACDKLNVDLHTIVADWEEFKDLQIAFLKASTPDADIPADYAIYSVLYHMADNEGIKYIFNGHSFRTEGTSPIGWTYMDPLYVRSVHKMFGKLKTFSSFPHMTFFKFQYYLWIRGIREIRLLEYLDYKKSEIDNLLKDELGWQYYGGHHHENMFTKFFQSYYLPKKFNIDKRKTEYSALIRSGQKSRVKALEEISAKGYEYDESVVKYVKNKLDLNDSDWESIINAPIKSHDEYRTYLPLIRLLRFPIKIAVKLKLMPVIFYLKYSQ